MKKEDIEFLKKLSETMRTQEHDCQAAPRFWVVAQSVKEYVGEDYGSHVDLVTEDGDTVIENANIKNVVDYFMKEYSDEVKERRITINHTPSYCEIFVLDKENGEAEEEETLFDVDDVIRFFEEHDIISDSYYRTVCYNINDASICPDTMFITKESCKNHIRLNGYHYHNPHTYAMTAWRSPEVEKLWKLLEETDWEKAIRKDSIWTKIKTLIRKIWHS